MRSGAAFLAIALMAATPAMACKNYTAIAIFDAIVAARDAAIEAQSERIQDARRYMSR